LPRAVEVTITLADWGEIRRLVAMVGGGPTAGGNAGQGQATGDDG
jgi:hypothetical protein